MHPLPSLILQTDPTKSIIVSEPYSNQKPILMNNFSPFLFVSFITVFHSLAKLQVSTLHQSHSHWTRIILYIFGTRPELSSLHHGFWASVEPYCADITNEEIRVLEELLKPPDDEAEYYKIPALGKHYSQRWAQEDLLEEQREGARANDKKKSLMGPLSELDAKDVDALLKKSESQHDPPDDGCPFGPLTQRLLQALVEENIISPMEDSPIPDISGKDGGNEGAGTSPRSQGKAFSVPHTRSLEARIKEELMSQGLLDSEERPGAGGDSEDEVLAELHKRQAELKALSAHNRSRKQELLRLAKEEMRKQELRQRVRVSDNEVMEGFRRIMAARQKKRTPTKKEKDQAWKALKERDSILKLLDG
ncbi:transcriptional adapter 3 isoform X2 [Oncorhynchus mykiss]|uniref:transcriptional adapter 3 isoform X2 n=1 Tax=Oncorhynchus mykiss TaxID=8022 RepID=UPI001878387A|nr:transcriptional adapter 3 isoform X2 [Oncorhynchus mykiss]